MSSFGSYSCTDLILSYSLLMFPVSLVPRPTDRNTTGECRLAEAAPSVVSSASSPRRLLLLPNRHKGRPGAQWPLPQCFHQEKFHSVTHHSPPSPWQHCPDAVRDGRCSCSTHLFTWSKQVQKVQMWFWNGWLKPTCSVLSRGSSLHWRTSLYR